MEHHIKIQKEFADAVMSGEKTFEIRWNDRGYKKNGGAVDVKGGADKDRGEKPMSRYPVFAEESEDEEMKADVENPKEVLEDILTRMNKGEIVERKIGTWEWVDNMDYRCSVCHKYAYGCLGEVLGGNYQFCPYCGAKMDYIDDGEEKTDE